MTQLTYVEKAPNILLGAVVEPRIKVIACECAEQATPNLLAIPANAVRRRCSALLLYDGLAAQFFF
jgi:hypothetical protein